MSFLASVVASAASSSASLPWAVGGALGWVGILFVLAGEQRRELEKKQREKYGGTPEYDEWCQKTWAGPVLTIPKQEPPKREDFRGGKAGRGSDDIERGKDDEARSEEEEKNQAPAVSGGSLFAFVWLRAARCGAACELLLLPLPGARQTTCAIKGGALFCVFLVRLLWGEGGRRR